VREAEQQADAHRNPGCTATFSVTVATVSQRRSAADAPGPSGFRAFSDIPSTGRAVATPAFPRVWLGCRSMSGGRRPIFPASTEHYGRDDRIAYREGCRR
jgi:hypothetical protein